MRRITLVFALVVAAAACDGSGGDPSAAASALPSPVDLPTGTPPSYRVDIDASHVPRDELVPRGTEATSSWIVEADGAQHLVVGYANGGEDLSGERGVIVWRRFEGEDPPWRPVLGVAVGEESFGVDAWSADVTGDGSPDVGLAFALGGSGSCTAWRVVDLAANDVVWDRDACDTLVAPAADPAGLQLTEAIYAEGDAHCCPSRIRRTVLVYAGEDNWHVAERHLERSA